MEVWLDQGSPAYRNFAPLQSRPKVKWRLFVRNVGWVLPNEDAKRDQELSKMNSYRANS